MANQQPPTLRPWSQRPFVDQENATLNQFHDWLITSVNALIGQKVPTAPGITALSLPTVDPTSNTIISAGSRPQSLATAFQFNAAANAITFYWDGTHSSIPLSIYRDDGTITGNIVGNQLVSGLAGATLYFFYPYYDEALGKVVFASVVGAVGTPSIAYTAQSLLAGQRQILRGHIPLALNLGTVGVTTGSGSGSGGGGGGGGGRGGGFK